VYQQCSDGLIAGGIAPVLLEAQISFRRELRAGDVVDVSCDTKFGAGKTFRMEQLITKLDGTLAAEISCTLGMMDLRARKLLVDPRAALRPWGWTSGSCAALSFSSAPTGC